MSLVNLVHILRLICWNFEQWFLRRVILNFFCFFIRALNVVFSFFLLCFFFNKFFTLTNETLASRFLRSDELYVFMSIVLSKSWEIFIMRILYENILLPVKCKWNFFRLWSRISIIFKQLIFWLRCLFHIFVRRKLHPHWKGENTPLIFAVWMNCNVSLIFLY